MSRGQGKPITIHTLLEHPPMCSWRQSQHELDLEHSVTALVSNSLVIVLCYDPN